MAAREFGGQPDNWQLGRADLLARGWLEAEDLAWQPDSYLANDPVAWDAEKKRAYSVVRAEIEELQLLMQDDRERYMVELDVQADGLADYVIHFLRADRERYPWTVELISCGLAIGNIAYMHFKQRFRRARPSFLCPGLVPPFGPPGHPSFPSGHSFLGHFVALLLLEVPAIAHRFGVFRAMDGSPGERPTRADLAGRLEIRSPLLWLGQRLGKNRERLGVHYASDTSGSRHLAAGIWWGLLHDQQHPRIDCPSLRNVLNRATAEWSSPWA